MDDIDLSDQVKKSEVYTYTLPVGAFLSLFKGGDFNGDGFMDVLIEPQVGSGTTPVSLQIFLGDGKGSFSEGSNSFATGTAVNTGGGGRSLEADFNNDGITDIFLLNFGNDAPPFSGGKNQLFLSSPTTHKLEEISSSLSQADAHNHGGSVGDVNGDGYLDILVNALDDSTGNVLLINDGFGHFTSQPSLIPKAKITNTLSGIYDINGDGHPDIILGAWPPVDVSSKSQVLLNNGSGNFTKISPIILPASGVSKEIVLDVKVIDLNGDDLPDLMLDITNGGSASISYHTPYIQLLINDGKGKFHDETSIRLPQSLVPSTGYIQMLSAVDFNHDGYSDILVTSGGGEFSSKVYMNRGDGTFYKYWESAPGGNSIAEDVNNDGMTDIVTGYSESFSVSLNSLTNGHIYKGTAEVDKFIGAIGNDTIDGGAGLDTVVYSGISTNYTITKISNGYTVSDNVGTEGIDILIKIERILFNDQTISLPNIFDGTSMNNTLTGTPVDDEIYGHDGNDKLTGGEGNDRLDGGEGNDALFGGDGDDIYYVNDYKLNTTKIADTVTEKVNEGDDTVISMVNYTLTINVERLILTGSSDLSGTGNKVTNTITGNGAANTINGKEGNDTLTGGAGNDTFVFGAKLNAATNVDIIADFTVGDVIHLSKKIFTANKTLGVLTDADFAIFNSKAFVLETIATATTALTKHFIFDIGTGDLYYDIDGNKTNGKEATLFATLTGVIDLTASDLYIVM